MKVAINNIIGKVAQTQEGNATRKPSEPITVQHIVGWTVLLKSVSNAQGGYDFLAIVCALNGEYS